MHGVNHYENFPVASWLCPPHLRSAVVAIYRFARTADDLADEGDAAAHERLAQLALYRQALDACALGSHAVDTRWPEVFTPLAMEIERHRLPLAQLHALLDAFEQDVRHTASGHRYPRHDDLLNYCRLSANPVGRLLLHLYGLDAAPALAQSDHVCTALQLINFWQDLSVDVPRGRWYLPRDVMARHRVSENDVTQGRLHAGVRSMMDDLTDRAHQHLVQGAPLCSQVPGRAGWELRLVVQGGLRVLQKIAQLRERALTQRPTLVASDAPLLAWRAVWSSKTLPLRRA